MAAALIHYDGIDRRRLIAAILETARKTRKRRPSQRSIAAALGVSQPTVKYHMQRLKEDRT
jgi:DNA-binding Lrp family transcriptional regulator